jgi:DNA primase catalytic core
MQFPPSFLDEIQNRLRMSDVVGKKVALKAHGREHQGLCPFHKEKSPSFTVSDEKGFYHCFGCGAHGGAINFVMETQGLPFVDAVKQLADMAGIAMPIMDKESFEKQKTAQSLYEIMDMACRFFQVQLPSSKIALSYIKQRGLKPESVAKFRIGYAPDDSSALKKHLESKNITTQQMLDLGLLAKNDRGDVYDKFRGRLMFPIIDIKNQVVAFGGRILGDGKPKYLNSPETQLFKKGDMLYNENNARTLAFKTGKVVVAEGYMDVIALDAAGIKTAMAPMGTAITENQIRRLWKMANEPVICLDGDTAGQRAMDRVAHLCLPMLEAGYTMKFAVLPEGLDPDDYIKKLGKDNMRKALQNAKPLSDVIWESESNKKEVKTPEGKAELEKRLNDIATKIKNQAVGKYYKDFFRNKLWEFYKTQKYKASEEKVQPTTDFDINTIEGCQTVLIILLLMYPELLQEDNVVQEYQRIEFASDKLDKIGQAIIEVSELIDNLTAQDLKTHLENQGMGNYIEYLNYIKQTIFLDTKIVYTYTKVLAAWNYYICMLELHYLENECDEKESLRQKEPSQELDEELEIRRQELESIKKKKKILESAFEPQ